MPSVSEKQRRMMGADLARARAGEQTRTGMNQTQLAEFASKPTRRQRRKANRQAAKVQHYQGGGSVASGMTPDQYALIIIDEFSKRGLDGQFAAKVASAESVGFTQFDGDGGHSHGPFQLYDGGLLSDFYAKGYSDPYDARQAASYAADYVARTHDWGPWHAARSMFAAGQTPTDGSHYNDGTVSYPGGGGSVSNPPPVSSGEGPPASQPGQYDNYTREQWAYMAAAQMGPKPANYTDSEWQYMTYAKGDQLRADYFNSKNTVSNPLPPGSPYPNLPAAGQNGPTATGYDLVGKEVTDRNGRSGTVRVGTDGVAYIDYHDGTLSPNGYFPSTVTVNGVEVSVTQGMTKPKAVRQSRSQGDVDLGTQLRIVKVRTASQAGQPDSRGAVTPRRLEVRRRLVAARARVAWDSQVRPVTDFG